MSLKEYKETIAKAKKEGYAIPQFNINNLEWAKYILEECQKLKSPVFLGVSTGAAKYMGGYNVVVGMVKGIIKDLNITIPVMIHLDHACEIDDCLKAYDAGFNSIMIDKSLASFEENVKITNIVAKSAPNALIEAEIGQIGGSEDDVVGNEKYTNLDQAIEFAENTAIDMLAPSLGTVHGQYKEEPEINFELMEKIATQTNLPLVLHGGSGLPDNILKECIKKGIVKINFNTEFQIAWNNEVRKFIENNKEVYDPRKIISSGENAIKETVNKYVSVLGSTNKG